MSQDLNNPEERAVFYKEVLGENWMGKLFTPPLKAKEVVISPISNIPELLDKYGKLWLVRETDDLGLGKGKRIATIRMKLRVDEGHEDEEWWIEDSEVKNLIQQRY